MPGFAWQEEEFCTPQEQHLMERYNNQEHRHSGKKNCKEKENKIKGSTSIRQKYMT